MNKAVSFLAVLILGVGLIGIALNLDSLSSILIWEIFVLLGIYVNGLPIRMIHMSKVKMEYADDYEASTWFGLDLGFGNMLPLIMEIQYQRQLPLFVTSVIDEYEAGDLKTPFIFKFAKILLKTHLLPICSLFLLFTMFGFPRILNDYTLYRGLTSEEFQMSMMGLSVFLIMFFLTVYNYTMYKIVDYSMEGQSVLATSKIKKIFMIFSVVFATYTSLMFVLTLIFGFIGFELPILNTLINLDMVNAFIVFAPGISFIQALILKGKLSSYQYVLNESIA